MEENDVLSHREGDCEVNGNHTFDAEDTACPLGFKLLSATHENNIQILTGFGGNSCKILLVH